MRQMVTLRPVNPSTLWFRKAANPMGADSGGSDTATSLMINRPSQPQVFGSAPAPTQTDSLKCSTSC